MHHYRVFSRTGMHISLRGNYMIKLRAFTAQADAKRRLSHNWDLARSLASRMNTDTQRGARRRESGDLSPRCKSRQALSHGPTTSSDTTRDSVSVVTPAPRSRLYDRGAASPQIDLPLPRFADMDFIIPVFWRSLGLRSRLTC